MSPMDQVMHKSAVDHLDRLKTMALGSPGSAAMQQAIADAQAQVNKYAPPAPAPTAAPTAAPASLEQWAKQVDQRLAQLEQVVQQVAAPALNEAAQAGAAIMSALGQCMTPDQAQAVQQRIEKQPEILASQDCKDAVEIFVGAVLNFKGAA